MLKVRRSNLQAHTGTLSSVLTEICEIRASHPIVGQDSFGQTKIGGRGRVPDYATRTVTTEFGLAEEVIGLPVPTPKHPKYWVGLHERWRLTKRNRAEFVDCGLRIYAGEEGADAAQLLRLEWVAPQPNDAGLPQFQGGHAGHPHWHIDSAALVGPEEFKHYLDVLTAPAAEIPPLESFDASTAPGISLDSPRSLYDCSWLPKVHLPAYARWMHQPWDGITQPGPHQSDLLSLEMLTNWWKGALRYIGAEIRTHG